MFFGLVSTHFSEPKSIYDIDFYVHSTNSASTRVNQKVRRITYLLLKCYSLNLNCQTLLYELIFLCKLCLVMSYTCTIYNNRIESEMLCLNPNWTWNVEVKVKVN